jgi:hypothetical protein
MHTYNGLGVTVLRNSEPGDPDLNPTADITLLVLVQYPPDSRIVDVSLLPIPPQYILPPVPGRCTTVAASDLQPADLTLPLPPDYVDSD